MGRWGSVAAYTKRISHKTIDMRITPGMAIRYDSVTSRITSERRARAVLIGDVNFLNFLFFFQDYHEKSSALLLSSAGLFAFHFLILKPSHKARPPPPTPAVMRVVTQQALANIPEDRRGKYPGQVDSCNPATAAPGVRNMPSTTRTLAI